MIKSKNPGYGYHGSVDTESGHNADELYNKMYDKIRRLYRKSPPDHKIMIDYLDSTHGRHLVGHEDDADYIKKDFTKFVASYKPSQFEENKMTKAGKFLEATEGIRGEGDVPIGGSFNKIPFSKLPKDFQQAFVDFEDEIVDIRQWDEPNMIRIEFDQKVVYPDVMSVLQDMQTNDKYKYFIPNMPYLDIYMG